MTENIEQSVIEWGKSALLRAALGQPDSMHLDMFPCYSYKPVTVIDDSLMLMDRLIEHFADDAAMKKVVIMTAIELSYSKIMTTEVPSVSSLQDEWNGTTPPEMHFLPRTSVNVFCDGEEYSRSIEIITPLSKKYDRKFLFSFYKCWRGRKAIENNWIEYERFIFRYFDKSGELLWQS